MEEPVKNPSVIVEAAKKPSQEREVAGLVIAIDRVGYQVSELNETGSFTVDK